MCGHALRSRISVFAYAENPDVTSIPFQSDATGRAESGKPVSVTFSTFPLFVQASVLIVQTTLPRPPMGPSTPHWAAAFADLPRGTLLSPSEAALPHGHAPDSAGLQLLSPPESTPSPCQLRTHFLLSRSFLGMSPLPHWALTPRLGLPPAPQALLSTPLGL